MRIVHLNDTYADTGGVGTFLRTILNVLDRAGITNIPVYIHQHEKQFIDNRETYHAPDLAGLKRVLDLTRPDFIVIHSVYDPSMINYIGENLPSVAYMHGFYPVCPGLAKYYRRTDMICTRPFGVGCAIKIYTHRCASARRPDNVVKIIRQTSAYQKAYKKVSRILVATHYMRDLYIQNGFDPNRITILPPFISFNKCDALPDRTPSRKILFAGRLEIEKGLPYLLRALVLMPPDSILHIAGDGTMREAYEKLARKLGVTDRVKFLGWLTQDQLAVEYLSARLVAISSLIESFGITGVEALCVGVPVVAFDVGGISEWLIDGETGYLVPPLDVEAMAKKMCILLDDDELARKMGQRGALFVRDRFAPEKFLDSLMRNMPGKDKLPA